MATNLSNTTPAAPAGGTNVSWQQDSSGNTSAYTSLGSTFQTAAPVAGVLTINAGLGNAYAITINAAITSSTVTNPTDGQRLTILWLQDSTGHAVVLPTNFTGATAPSTSANVRSIQTFIYYAATSQWIGTAAGQTGV